MTIDMETRVMNIYQAFGEIPEYFKDMGIDDYDLLDIFLEGDPDLIMISGVNSPDDYLYTFCDFKYENTQYVVHDSDDDRVEQILTDFFSEDWMDKFEEEESDWRCFGPGRIAYRGGSGYYYAIWKIKN